MRGRIVTRAGLSQILDKHLRWLGKGWGGERANLRGADLGGESLRETNLCKADLSEANLHRADLSGTGLREANLCGADLRGAILHESDLSGANLREANLRGADLRGAVLYKANLSAAVLCGADLGKADLRGVVLCGADLHNAYLDGVALCRADLYGANLCQAVLGGMDLYGARNVLRIGPIGSRADELIAVRHDTGVMVKTGCFWGDLNAFGVTVTQTYGDSRVGHLYRCAIELIEQWENDMGGIVQSADGSVL